MNYVLLTDVSMQQVRENFEVDYRYVIDFLNFTFYGQYISVVIFISLTETSEGD